MLLALGGSDSPSDSDLERLEDSVKQARDRGINVVAAAGNDGADEVVYPARLDEVLAVGAAEHDGGLCSFSNHGEGLDLTAPGCELDTADPRSGDETEGNGTSHAAAIVAATIAALRTYDEDIDVDEAEGLILDTTDDDTLDVEASFQRAGLDEVVEAGRNNIPDRDEGSEDAGARRGGRDAGRGSSGGSGSGGSDTRGEPGDTVPLAPLPPTLAALPAPSFTHVVRRGVLRLRLRNRPPGARALVTLYRRSRGEFGHRAVRRLELRGTVLRRRVAVFTRVSVTFEAPGRTPSETVHRR